MSEENSKNQQHQERPIEKRPSEVNIERGKVNERIERGHVEPLSWQPIKDQTNPNPPDGGSGVGESSDD